MVLAHALEKLDSYGKELIIIRTQYYNNILGLSLGQ
jgi:hypothetical protein